MAKVYNGGITVTVGNYTIDVIKSYAIQTTVEAETFTNWDNSTASIFRGYRYSVNVSTGWMTEEEMKALRGQLAKYRVVISDSDGNFDDDTYFTVSSISNPLQKADLYGKYYQISFAATSVQLYGGSGNL